VSVTSGVANLASAFPALIPWTLEVSLAMVVVLTVVNLRGVKESGFSFAAPTYLFIGSVLIMLGMAAFQTFTGHPPVAESAHYPVATTDVVGATAIFLLLRAFASGCTALTGVEAISNGVPFFRPPKSRNAALTLVAMGSLAVVMFGGVTWLAVESGAKIAENPVDLGLPAGAVQQTVIAQLGSAVFGAGSIGFFALQLFTTAVLVLAANTAYNSFPIMASVLGRDGYLPRQFGRRGDRLVFSNGVIILATAAALLIIAFDASVTHLVQLYILGVFLSFTISQAGMVRHWGRCLRTAAPGERGAMHRSRILNAVGATVTAVVLVIVVLTKFSHGAWLVMIAIPLFVLLMVGIHRHYERTERRQAAPPGGVTLPARVHAVVLISRLNAPAMQALAFARAARPSTLVGLHVQTERSNIEALAADWDRRGIPVPLVLVESPFRDVTGPAVDYVKRLHAEHPGDMIAVYVPEYVVSRWWETLLHNQSAIRLKTRLLFVPGVVTTSVPTLLAGTTEPRQPDTVVPPLPDQADAVTPALPVEH
jgi:amino acid transporter